jgi:hypothetical protein
MKGSPGWEKLLLLLLPLFETGCSRAPSFDILGSFFPAWLICVAVAIPLTVLARWVLSIVRITIFFPVLVYPSITAIFTFALWLTFFR